MEEVINNVDFWIAIAAQAPLLAGFMYFMLRWQSSDNETTQRNHHEWQEWLTEERAKAREERKAWREHIRNRDTRHLSAMASLEKQIVLQSNILMTLVAASGTDIEKTMDTLEKLTEQTVRSE